MNGRGAACTKVKKAISSQSLSISMNSIERFLPASVALYVLPGHDGNDGRRLTGFG